MKSKKRVARVERPKEPKEPNPDSLRMIWTEVCHKQKGLMVAMGVLLFMSAILLVFSLTTLRPQNTVVIVGYGDVYGEIAGISGGYRRSSWVNMLAFPVLAILFGVLHNVLALRIYRKYSKDTALALVVMSMALVVATFVVILRLTGEW